MTLVGFCLGAYLAARALPHVRERVDRMVLIAGFPALPAELVAGRQALADAIERGEVSPEVQHGMAVDLFLGSVPRDPTHVALVGSMLAATGPGKLLRNLRRLKELSGPAAAVKPFDTPALVAHATGDQAIPFALGASLATYGSSTRFLAVESDRHMLPITHADEVATWVFSPTL